jgi:hypothetical protein
LILCCQDFLPVLLHHLCRPGLLLHLYQQFRYFLMRHYYLMLLYYRDFRLNLLHLPGLPGLLLHLFQQFRYYLMRQ